MDCEEEVDYEAEEQPDELAQPADDGLADEVYGDLFDADGEKRGVLLKAQHVTLQEECEGLRATIARLQQEAQAAAAEKAAGQEERRILVRNISCVFRTAREELDRKDAALRERDAALQRSERQGAALRAQLGRAGAEPQGAWPPPPPPPPQQQHPAVAAPAEA